MTNPFFSTLQGYVKQDTPIRDINGWGVVGFGASNTYPQECEYALSNSGIAGACIDTFTDFLFGDGFEDESAARAIVNDKGETLNEVLMQAVEQFATFYGFALLLNVNVLGEYTSIECFPFKDIRLSTPDAEGRYTTAKVWDNWAYESPRLAPSTADIATLPLFNPATILEEVEAYGGIERYPGQLLYFTMNGGYYTPCTFDRVFEQVLATGNIPKFANNFIRNGFSSSAIIVNKNVSPDADTRAQNLQMFNKHLGGIRNAGNMGYIEGEFELLDISNTAALDKQYVEIHERLKQDIIEAFQIPPILLGAQRHSGFPNQDEMRYAYTYYNSKTRKYRALIAKQFEEIARNFVYPIGENFTIKTAAFA